MTLSKLGKLSGKESPEEISAAWDVHKKEQNETRVKIELKDRADCESRMKEIALGGMRARLAGAGTDQSGMDEDDLKQAVQKIDERERATRNEMERKRLAERFKEQADRLFKNSNCPKRHADAIKIIGDSENPRWHETRDLLIEQAGYANGFLVALLGNRGTGKTQLCAAVIKACTGRMMTCRYVKAIDLFRSFRGAYVPVAKGERGQDEQDIIEMWASFDLLVIDECHQRGETTAEQNTLINLLDRRYDARLCTILIANQDKEQFAASIGESVVSRIHQTGDAIICDWPSYRKPGNWKQNEGAEPRIASGYPKAPRTYHD